MLHPVLQLHLSSNKRLLKHSEGLTQKTGLSRSSTNCH